MAICRARSKHCTLFLLAGLAPARLDARPHDAGALPQLHVNDTYGYTSCFFDLSPELTKGDFQEFAREVGSILRFRQLADARTLGKGRRDISVQWTRSPIDDAKGAWNNTMAHPRADHYLGDAIALPRIAGRFGVSDRVDVGAWCGFAPGANFGFVGGDTNIALITQGRARRFAELRMILAWTVQSARRR